MSSSYTHSSQLTRGIQVEWLSVVWMVKAVAAMFAGVMAHSIALIAFGADSIIELVAGGALLFRLHVEANRGDSERVKGAERAASRIVGVALLALAAYIVVSSAVSLLTTSRPEATSLGIGIAVASSILMPFLATTKKRVGRRIGSRALISDGACSMVCAYMSWILLAGVAATALLGWWWADSVAALGFVWFVVREGLEAISEACESDKQEEETRQTSFCSIALGHLYSLLARRVCTACKEEREMELIELSVRALVNGHRVRGILTNDPELIGPDETVTSKEAGSRARFERTVDGKVIPRDWHTLDVIEE